MKTPNTGSRILVTAVYWMGNLIKRGNAGREEERNGGEVGKGCAAIVNRTSGTSWFLSRRRHKGGGIGAMRA